MCLLNPFTHFNGGFSGPYSKDTTERGQSAKGPEKLGVCCSPGQPEANGVPPQKLKLHFGCSLAPTRSGNARLKALKTVLIQDQKKEKKRKKIYIHIYRHTCTRLHTHRHPYPHIHAYRGVCAHVPVCIHPLSRGGGERGMLKSTIRFCLCLSLCCNGLKITPSGKEILKSPMNKQ